MSFSWLALVINTIAVLISAVIAFSEKRLTTKQMGLRSIPWVKHGGTWADLFIMGPILGFIMPYGKQMADHDPMILGSALIAIAITIICHTVWALTQDIPGHITNQKNKETQKLIMENYSLGEAYHILYMSTVLWMIIDFFWINFQEHSNSFRIVSVLLSVFIIPAVIQPGLFCNRFKKSELEKKKNTKNTILTAVWIWIFILFFNL